MDNRPLCQEESGSRKKIQYDPHSSYVLELVRNKSGKESRHKRHSLGLSPQSETEICFWFNINDTYFRHLRGLSHEESVSRLGDTRIVYKPDMTQSRHP